MYSDNLLNSPSERNRFINAIMRPMKLMDISYPTPEENLACDEALLELSENGLNEEVLRFWESPVDFVVLGFSNKAAREVKLAACEAASVPVLRRSSGGGTVLQGPGCLNYSLVLQIPSSGPLRNLKGTNEFIMQKNRDAMRTLLGPSVETQGITDLTFSGLKFSGNAQRRKRNFLLFHGTFLYAFNLRKIETFLDQPSLQPDYRKNRPHEKFVGNVPLKSEDIKVAMRRAWDAHKVLTKLPDRGIEQQIAEKFSRRDWNFKF